MNDTATCPHCREDLDIPLELFGQPVRCASCREVFIPPVRPLKLELESIRRPDLPSISVPIPKRTTEASNLDFDSEPRPQRKSNVTIWVLVLLMLFVMGGGLMSCLGLLWFTQNPEMVAVEDADAAYEVEFPGDAKPIQEKGELGAEIAGYELRRPMSKDLYFVRHFALPANQQNVAPADVLDQICQKQIENLGAGAEFKREQTKHQGYPALDVWLQKGKNFVKVVTIIRIIVAKGRVYVLVASGANLQPQSWWVRQFFRSFKINTK